MEGNKSFLMYIFVFIFIGLIIVFYVIPNSKEEVLSCTLLTNETGIITTYRVESIYQHNKFQYVNIDMELDINRYWIKKNDYIYSLEKDSKGYFYNVGKRKVYQDIELIKILFSPVDKTWDEVFKPTSKNTTHKKEEK